MSAQPTTAVVAAEAVLHLDGTGTWSVGVGTIEEIRAATAADAFDEVLHRTVVAAAERGTAIELIATLAGAPILFRVSPTGEITGSEVSGVAPGPTSSSLTGPASQAGTEHQAPLSGAELAELSYAEEVSGPSSVRPPRRPVWRRGWTAVTRAVRPRWAVAAVAGALAAAAVGGLVLTRMAGDDSPSPSTAGDARPETSAPFTRPFTRPLTTRVVPALATRKLEVTVTARKGGPLTARVRATAAPTVVTITVWQEGRRIAMRRLQLTDASATWSSGIVTFAHTGPGRYRWSATAPRAARASGRYEVPVKPAPPERRSQPSTSAAVAGAPPSSSVPASSSSPSSPTATRLPTAAPPPTPLMPSPPAAPTPPHNGPVPGGNTSPPHTGPRP